MPATSSKVTRTVSGSTGLLAAAAEQAAERALLPLEHPDVEADQQQDRRERDQQVREEAALLHERRRAHRRAAARQLRQQVVVGERRPLGRELLVGPVRLSRLRDGLLQLALDRVAAREHLRDVLAADLGLEFRVGHRLRPGQPVLHREQAEQHQVADQPRRHHPPARPSCRRFGAGQSLGAPRARGARWCPLLLRWFRSAAGGSWRILRGHVCIVTRLRQTANRSAAAEPVRIDEVDRS